MFKNLLFILIFIFVGCQKKENNEVSQTQKKRVNLDGKKLLKEKCSSCHNIDFPPKDFKNEIAPPMMTISFHFNDWFKANSKAEKLLKQQEFVADYVINPSIEKSYCDKKMLKKYGLMPSQKGKVTKEEVKAIAKYVFTTYTQENLTKKQKALEKLHSLPLGEQLVIKYRCTSCHQKDKKIVGPAFSEIAKRYNDKNHIIDSIKNGSKNRWKESNNALMPPFKNISDKDLETISKWILSL